ncbi:MAG: hypothetical protein AAF563_22110 [Pseudomonadota bacterium]
MTFRFGVVVLSAFGMAGLSAGAAEAQEGFYPTEYGTVEYSVEGMQSGTTTRYWRDWGREQAEYQDLALSISGITQETKTWTITTPETVTNIDLTTNQGTQIANPMANAYNMSEEELENFNQTMMQNMGGQLVGTDTIAGQDCEVWDLGMTGGSMCVWEGVPLANDAGGGMLTMTAVSIDTDTPVDEIHFTVPDDVTFTTPGAGTGDVPSLEDLMQSLGQTE